MNDEPIHLLRALVSIWVTLVFVGIVAWAFWPRRKARLEALGRIPLDDETGSER
ncbi:MAG: cbb3-type cytochrome c oxidase subunit 3 [Rhodospirillaceae bacterium]|nr:cbb3-type cytochrome c oxidase subunit 3 [Rhodospirillaceae bacterium]